ncbi:hypothetical protein BDZ94DRAFT_944392 [Collybia nuda]|uniref:Uncharacterized protein n=1 Tax=Collybia nuda TaxID=64659 RepID=A0A9P6CGR4_9AGAR|nr:hypothetical protein BDZ94DRAFT_944392 [Collybia nuda]
MLSQAPNNFFNATRNMLVFTFTETDLLNTPLLPSHHSNAGRISYTLRTKKGILGRKITTLSASGGHSTHTLLGGAINWRKKRFEIGGVRRKCSGLKHRTGLFSSSQEWNWSGQHYVIKYSRNQWMATCSSSRDSPSAVFTVRRSHFFRKSEPATIAFSPDLPQDDVVFLILVIIFSEMKRKEDEVAVAEATSNVIGLATN